MDSFTFVPAGKNDCLDDVPVHDFDSQTGAIDQLRRTKISQHHNGHPNFQDEIVRWCATWCLRIKELSRVFYHIV